MKIQNPFLSDLLINKPIDHNFPNQNTRLEALNDMLFKEVPERGESKNQLVEIYRTFANAYYDLINNGFSLNRGYWFPIMGYKSALDLDGEMVSLTDEAVNDMSLVSNAVVELIYFDDDGEIKIVGGTRSDLNFIINKMDEMAHVYVYHLAVEMYGQKALDAITD